MNRSFIRFLHKTGDVIKHPATSYVAFIALLVWIGFGYSIQFPEWWFKAFELIGICITILLAIIIESTQRADTQAMQEKLDEIIRGLPKSDNAKIGLEKKLRKEKE